MALPIPEKASTIAAAQDAMARFTELLRGVRDPSANAIGHWSIGETGVHVGHVVDILGDVLEGNGSPVKDHRNMAAHWEVMLAEDTERDTRVLADRIDKSLPRCLAAAADADWTDIRRWHAGLEVPVYTATTLLMNEADIHGFDIATAEGRPWSVPAEDARIIIEGLLPLLPNYLTEDAATAPDVTYRVRLRGGNTAYFALRSGKLQVSAQAPGPIDCTISADPSAYLLVGYGRASQWRALLTGKLVAYGKKPWLGLRFGKLFTSP